MITIKDIIQALVNTPIHEKEQISSAVISDAVIDSRQAIPGCLFIAIPGENVDGHDYVKEAFERGALVALVQRPVDSFTTIDLRQGKANLANLQAQQPFCLLVENTVKGLQVIARHWRHKLDVKVIGITGSVGKSTTKEITAEILEQKYTTLKNLGNFNNEIGLPLTLIRLSEDHQRAVLEMGFYVPGEIDLLCEIATPEIGVITNVGTVHAERAGSQEVIAHGKAELVRALPSHGTAILNYDDDWVRRMAAEAQARVLFYGLDPKADLWADQVESFGLQGIRFQMHYQGRNEQVTTPMIGEHSVYTALRAAAVGFVDGLDWQEILRGLEFIRAQLRMITRRSKSGALLIDDSYNSAPESALAALDLLYHVEGRKIAILGDMLELGPYEEQGHYSVGLRAASVVEELITVGERARNIARAAQKAGLPGHSIMEFANSQEAAESLRHRYHEQDVVLIKGSRGMRMEKIVNALEVES